MRSGEPGLHVKLIEFGQAITIEKGQLLKQTVGTPYYIAPEVLRNNYDQKCDIWSIGVLLYILLSGMPPFDGENNDEILRAVTAGRVSFDAPMWQMISLEGKDFLSKLLCYHAVNRSSAFMALQHDWFRKFEKDTQVGEL